MTSGQILTLILLPIISAAIGYVTNWVAVKMLLKPLRPINVLGLRIQGLLPRRHVELADRISSAISKDFLTEKDILEFLKKVDPAESLRGLMTRKWDEKIGEFLDTMPMVRMFLAPERLDEIRDRLIDSLLRESDDILVTLAEGLEGKLDVKEVIRTNILAFDLKKLDDIIEEIAKREFREIEMLGGVLGFLIGMVQAVLVIWVLPR